MELPGFSESPGNSFTAPFAQRIEVARQETLLQQKMARPEFSIGYFNQSIRPDYSFQGVQAGVSIPLWKKAQGARIQQAQIAEAQAMNTLTHQEQIIGEQFSYFRNKTALLFEELNTSGQDIQQKSATLRTLAKLQFQQGDINYFDYVQSLNVALSNDLDYLDLLFNYNQSALYLEYLSGE